MSITDANNFLNTINQWIKAEDGFVKEVLSEYYPFNPQLTWSNEPAKDLKEGATHLCPDPETPFSWNYSISVHGKTKSGIITLAQLKDKCRPENLQLLNAIETKQIPACFNILNWFTQEMAVVLFQGERSLFRFSMTVSHF